MDKGLTLASMLNDVQFPAGMQVPVLTGSRRTHHRVCRSNSLTSGAGSVEKRGDGRAMRAMGVDYAAEYLQRFGSRHKTLSTPNRWRWVQLPSPNAGGARLRGHGERRLPGGPVFISKIENDQGGVIFEAKPKEPARNAIFR